MKEQFTARTNLNFTPLSAAFNRTLQNVDFFALIRSS